MSAGVLTENNTVAAETVDDAEEGDGGGRGL